jgi:hypothetical protein
MKQGSALMISISPTRGVKSGQKNGSFKSIEDLLIPRAIRVDGRATSLWKSPEVS